MDDSFIVESESLRPDRRANRAGCVIIAHQTRESFMKATGGPVEKLPPLPAAEAHRAMLAAWEEKYGAAR